MGDQSLRLEGVYTFSSGTLLRFGDASPHATYFYDANNNQRLDLNDKKVLEKSQRQHISQFSTTQVSEKDVQTFGGRVDAALARARRERSALPRSIVPQKTGECYFSMEGEGLMTVKGLPFRFDPPLSISTRRALKDNVYPVSDLLKFDKKSPLVDPTRCFGARAFFALGSVDKRPLDPKEAEIATGDMMVYPIFVILGLKNGTGLDAAYTMADGAEHVHIDLNP